MFSYQETQTLVNKLVSEATLQDLTILKEVCRRNWVNTPTSTVLESYLYAVYGIVRDAHGKCERETFEAHLDGSLYAQPTQENSGVEEPVE
jgi:hypothetical protein